MNSSAGGAETLIVIYGTSTQPIFPMHTEGTSHCVLFHTILIKIRLLPTRGVGATDLGGVIGIKVIEVDRAAWTTEIVEIDREVAL